MRPPRLPPNPPRGCGLRDVTSLPELKRAGRAVLLPGQPFSLRLPAAALGHEEPEREAAAA